MGEAIVAWFADIFGQGIGQVIGVFFISMLPIIELRGAIPVAYMFNFQWWPAMMLAMIGNMLPVPIILFFVEAVFDFMKKHNILKGFVEKMEQKATAKTASVEKYRFWGLALFVAIPLPGTGAWTGALIASMMKMNKKDAMLSILVGVVGAGFIVTALVYGLVGSIVGWLG